ncbi:PilZ domain-containing protein [Cohnella lubricantis]|uniref:PilZ domain-containing protein n=1 Tax=Cohnella lubricantis TaxID=2163172 RepID=A0A841TF99_9BACL|nr:PilZ domain-containing protein [Cohnella lubricantis]MBB6677968.1 PilZ domain-containing protein [Cohnella lubricantis]MBP2119964.1 c-di-GMP-binding flagellar brake protein YcgR [Cohnella lubricantis]
MAHRVPIQPDKDSLSVKSLLHCRTVIANSHFVATGIMTQVEGELFEIELHEFNRFELGEAVTMTVYSPAGIQTFQSIVFAKYEGAVAVIQPPLIMKKFQEKREYFRVETTGKAKILRVVGERGETELLPEPLEAELSDISIAGVGLRIPKHPALAKAAQLGAILDLGFMLECELEIVRRDRADADVLSYGMRMKLQDMDMMRPLRAFVLRKQVEKQIELRGQAVKKRS